MGEFLTKEKVKEVVGAAPPEIRKDVFQRLVDRGYEIEGFNAEFSPLDTVKNIPGSLASFGKAIWSAVSSPVQTVNALDSVAKGAARSFWKAVGVQPKGYSQDDEGNFEAMVDFFVDRYGSTDKLLNTIEKDPVGFLSDASVLVSGGAGAVKGLATTAAKVATTGGKVAKIAGAVGKGAEVTQKYARILEPATAVTKTARRLNKAVGLNKFANRVMRDLVGAGDTFIKDIARGVDDPTNFLTNHGISGSLPQMSRQLDKVADLTYRKVNELLEKVPGKYKNADTLSLLNEELRVFSKSADDIVEGTDVVKVKTRTGEKTKQIPFKQREPLNIPKENLSQESLSVFNRIKELRQKYISEGLTVTELNEVKRLSDQTLSIYKKSIGEPKSAAKAQELARLRSSTQKFIENKATEAGISNIRGLNRQTQLSNAWKDVVDERILLGRQRISLWERLTLIGGVTGATIAGGTQGLFASLGLVGVMEVSRIPRVRTFLVNRVSLMAKGEFDKFLGEIDTFSKTQKLGKLQRQIREEALRYARPAGIVEQKAEEQQRIPIRTQ